MRSLLLLPPDHPELITAALGSGADALAFDLAHSGIGSVEARHLAREALALGRTKRRPLSLYVRIHDLRSEEVDADLDAVMPLQPDGILLPRSQGGADIEHLSAKLSVHEALRGFPDGKTQIFASVGESPAAIFRMASYVDVSRRLAGLVYGGAELALAFGLPAPDVSDEQSVPPLALARSLTLFTAKAAQVVAIDAASPCALDPASLRRNCELARRDGFSGKVALHKDQIAIIHGVFT